MVTGAGELVELLLELPVDEPDEFAFVVDPEDVVAEDDVLGESPLEAESSVEEGALESSGVLVVVAVVVDAGVDADETMAACWPEDAVVPIEPSNPMTPNASANVAAAVAAMRRRMSEMRRRRASRRSRAISFGDRDGSGVGAVVGMAVKLGAARKRTLEEPCEVPERGSRRSPSGGSGPSQPASALFAVDGFIARAPHGRSHTMKPRVRRLAMIAGAGALLGTTGCGAATTAQQSSSATTTQSQAQSAPALPGTPPAGRPPQRNLGALAAKLGVSTATLTKAMQAIGPTAGANGAPPRADMPAALAKQLGLSTAKVRAALDAVRPPGAPPQGAAPGSRPGTGSTTGGSTTQS
ncbi:MAG: hypothetical protein QOJ21_674 [Solirubrobacteraceae bacterium]|nr:hypothetical protein [Solirubrobacteraceae bacterium]